MKKLLSTILSIMLIFFLILLYSRFVGTIGLETNEISIKTNLNDNFNGLKIIQFSDLHYKKVITEKRIKELINEINKNKPDIAFFTGDLLDKDYKLENKDINFLITELKKIKTTYGIYAIMGDNDYSNEEILKNIYLQSNITLLNNESIYIYNEFNDKIILQGFGSYLKNFDLNKTISSLEEDNTTYKISLVHEPDAINNIIKQTNSPSLILAGHSLNGSINIPIIKTFLLPNGAKKFKANKQNKNIYISNGIGVNNINFRLFNTPSINLYRLSNK